MNMDVFRVRSSTLAPDQSDRDTCWYWLPFLRNAYLVLPHLQEERGQSLGVEEQLNGILLHRDELA